MTDPSLPSWWRVAGTTLLAVFVAVALEGLALLTPPAVGLAVVVGALVAGAALLASPRTAALRRQLRLDGPAPSPERMVPGMVLVALFVLSSLLVLREATKTIDIPMLSRILEDRGLVNRLRLVGIIVLLGPIAEEVALRGWLQTQLERRWRPAAAVAVAALVFGVMHGVDVRLGYFVALGAMFGAAAIAFRSLWAPIVLHMSVNAMGAVPLLLGTPGAPPPAITARAPSPWWGVAGAALVVLAYGRWLRRAARGARQLQHGDATG